MVIRQNKQIKGTEYRCNTCKYSQLIFAKEAEAIQWRKDNLLTMDVHKPKKKKN